MKKSGVEIKWLACAFMLMLHAGVRAQTDFTTPLFLHINDRMVQAARYADITDGSPFFQEEFTPAAIFLAGGKQHFRVQARLNLLDQELQYLDENGNEMVSTQPLSKVVFLNEANDTSAVFLKREALGISDNQLTASWVQVLAGGKATLVKNIYKEINATKGYSSATVVKTIVSENRYYLWLNGELKRVKTAGELAAFLNLSQPADSGRKPDKSEQAMLMMIHQFNRQ